MKIIAIGVILLFGALLFIAALAFPDAFAATEAAPHAPRADVLVVERAYTGTIERTGTANTWAYTNGAMLVDFTPDGDGLFRNGFDLAEFSSCRP